MTTPIHSPLTSTAWLADHLNDASLRIVDCSQIFAPPPGGGAGFRPALAEFAAGHIPGSVYVDIASQLSDPDQSAPMMMPPPAQLAETFRLLGIGDDTQVVLYDRSNHAWAARVWWMLRGCGFDNAAVLNGGWIRWTREGRPQSTAMTAYPPAPRFSAMARPQLMADKARVLQAIDDDSTALLHSLPRAMFTGEINAYGRPGRIPGSVNLYSETLLDPETNSFPEPATLREHFAAIGVLDAGQVITYCGGGIAASNNALLLTLLGHEGVAVYDASLGEWAADPELPMECD